MQSFVAVLGYIQNSPLLEKAGKKLTKKDLTRMSSFFNDEGRIYATVS